MWVRIGFVLLAIASGVMVFVYAMAWLLIPMDGESGNIYSRAITDRRGIRTTAAILLPLLVAVQFITTSLHVPFIGILGWPTFLAIGVIVLIWRNAGESEKAFIDEDVMPLLGTDRHGSGRRWLIARMVLGVLVGAAGIAVLVEAHTTAAACAASRWRHPRHCRRRRHLRPLVAEPGSRSHRGAPGVAPWPRSGHRWRLTSTTRCSRRWPSFSARPMTRYTWCSWPGPRSASCAAWLFEGRPPGAIGEDATMLAEGVGLLQRQVEADHGIAVQVVMVGDCPLDEALRAVLDATRGATVNAAKWSRADQVSVYAEVETDTVMVYVRDRGRGFDPDAVPDDRQGIAQSIRARVARSAARPSCVPPSGKGPRCSFHAAPGAGQVTDGTAVSASSPASGGRPRIFLVEDHAVFRAGVGAELGDAVEVVGEADEAAAAVELISERLPDVVLLDVHLPGGGGHAVLRGVLPHHPEVQFLALSVSDAPEDVIDVIRAGARGDITKTISGPELLQAVYRVAAGDAVFSPRLAGFVLDAFAQGGGPAPGLDPELDQLSPREREVLRLIARGYTYKEVARDLSISAKTVESHVSSVLRKLQLSTRHELTRWATDRRLV